MEERSKSNRKIGRTVTPLCGCARMEPIRSGPPQPGRTLNYPRFWQSLIMNQHAKLHAHCFPSRTRRLVARGKWKGTALTYTILPQTAIIAYRFRREGDQVHALYQQLNQHRDEIEKRFGASLEWFTGTEQKHDYLRYTIRHTGIEDERSWREVQKEMISCMNRLKAAVEPVMSLPGVRR